MDDLTQKIRDRAYQIWIDEGRPEGMEMIHWQGARAEIETSDDTAGGSKVDKERRLDGALDGTFPTSDTPSESQPGGGITGPGDER